MNAAEVLCEEFFTSGRVPVNSHEEWLLRMCAQMMFREASVVSVLENTAKEARTSQEANNAPRRKRNHRKVLRNAGQHQEEWKGDTTRNYGNLS